MYAALNQKGNFVYAMEAVLQPGRYYCPKCQQVVILKQSRNGKPFFAHLRKCQTASNAVKKQLSGESVSHQVGKRLLARADARFELEKWLPNLQQQVDCWLGNSPAIIFEFQNSIITNEQLALRHQAYLTITPKVYWFSHLHYWQTYRVASWQRLLIHYEPHWGYYWLGVDPDKELLIRYAHLPVIFSAQSWSVQKQLIKLQSGWLKLFNQNKFVKATFYNPPLAKIKWQRLKQGYQHNPEYFSVLKALRSKDYTLDQLPDWIFQYQWQSFLIETPMWVVLSLVWSRLMQPTHAPDFIEIQSNVEALINERIVKLAPLPLVSHSVIEDVVKAIHQCFCFYLGKK